MVRAKVVGVHPVDAPEACHLVEMTAEDIEAAYDIGDVTQPVDGSPRSSWQVPWDERFLDLSGCSVLDEAPVGSPHTADALRVVFFFHYLDLDRPLLTPWGELQLPLPTARPARLGFMRYEPPC